MTLVINLMGNREDLNYLHLIILFLKLSLTVVTLLVLGLEREQLMLIILAKSLVIKKLVLICDIKQVEV